MPQLPFDAPPVITQKFGEPHPRYSALGLAGHNGIDFALPTDTPLVAPDSGEVWEVGADSNGYGYYIKIRTPRGEDWLLAHCQLWGFPRPGTWVAAGAPVAFSNNSGMSTGPHLHLGYRSRWWVRGWPFNGYENPPLAQIGASADGSK